MEEEVIPGKRKDCDIEEERRLAYVAVTRARKGVMLTHSLSRVTPWGEIVAHNPSRFIKELLP
jgi:DNA helicase-2/ATP-dependent DNA helicase PcrA